MPKGERKKKKAASETEARAQKRHDRNLAKLAQGREVDKFIETSDRARVKILTAIGMKHGETRKFARGVADKMVGVVKRAKAAPKKSPASMKAAGGKRTKPRGKPKLVKSSSSTRSRRRS